VAKVTFTMSSTNQSSRFAENVRGTSRLGPAFTFLR